MKSISLTGGEGGYFEQGFNVTIPKNLVNSIRVRYVSFPRMNEEASGSKKVHRMRNFWVGPSICSCKSRQSSHKRHFFLFVHVLNQDAKFE